MIYTGSFLVCKDNSGARIVQCIGLNSSSKKRGAHAGQIITVVVKVSNKGFRWVQRGSIHKALILKTKNIFNWSVINGELALFFTNAVTLVNKTSLSTPLGTRIFGFVAKELRYRSFIWIVLLSTGVF